jgi:hypothetical protein
LLFGDYGEGAKSHQAHSAVAHMYRCELGFKLSPDYSPSLADMAQDLDQP